MFAGQADFFDSNLDPETKLRNYKYVVTPKMMVCKMYRRN